MKYRIQTLHVLLLLLSLTTGVISQKPCTAGTIDLKPNPAGDYFRFAAAGDTGMGCDPDAQNPGGQCVLSKRMLEIQKTTKFSHLMLLGDNVYTFGNFGGFKRKLYGPYDELSRARVLIKGVVGNHDVYNYDGAQLQMKFFNSETAAEQRCFFETSIEEQKKFEGPTDRYYSFSGGNNLVEFFALDSNMLTRHCCGLLFWKRKFSKEETADHVAWLKNALAKSTAKWKIVMLHHPFYSSARSHGVSIGSDGKQTLPKQMKRLRSGDDAWVNIEEILVNSGVDVVLAGHDHVYERIAPQNGIQHFVTGAGAKLRKNDFKGRLPTFHQCGVSTRLSFMLFDVTPDAISFWSIDKDGKAFDSGMIERRNR